MKPVLEAIQFPAAHIEVTLYNDEGSFNTPCLVSSSTKETSEMAPLEMQCPFCIAKSISPSYKSENEEATMLHIRCNTSLPAKNQDSIRGGGFERHCRGNGLL
jgi:hypothetical protein